MKKIFLSLALALTISVANAWNKEAETGIVILATKHLSAQGQSLVNQYLGADYYDDVQYLLNLEKKKSAKHTKEIHYLHLGSDMKPLAVEGDDAYKALNEAISVVRSHSAYPKAEVVKAMRVIINLMIDIHHLSSVRIEGIPHSQSDFKILSYGGDIGSRAKRVANIKWSTLWSSYTGWHTGFSGALWAEDIELCHGKRSAEFAKGNLNDWVAQIGTVASEHLSRIKPNYEMTRRERNELEYVNYEMMARAGYRLATLFNDIAK